MIYSDFAKEKVFWTRKMNLKLVKFIENRPNIWNPKHPKYTSVAYRDRTYAEFAAKYGNEFTGQAVKDRWTNIRSTFANYLRKLNASRAKGDTEKYKVNWHLWNACKFLLKVNKKNRALNSTVKNSNEKIKMDQETYETESIDETETASNLNCNDIINNLVTVFQNIHNHTIETQNNKYDEIGRIIEKRLSEMNSYESAKMMNRITEILLLYNQNNDLNPNNIKVEQL